MENDQHERMGIPFTQVPNVLLYDKRLSLRAKGLWAYMQAKPTGWSFSAERIARETDDGVESIRAGFKELMAFGYMSKQKLATGQMLYSLVVQEEPKSGKTQTGKNPNREKTDHNKERVIHKERVNTSSEVLEPAKKVKLDPNRAIDFDEELKKMVASNSRPLKVMAAFWRRKGYSFTVHKQMSDRIKRDIRSASTLATYSPEQITMSMDYCQTEYPQMWTLETCIKRIDDLIAQQNLPQFADEHDDR